MTIFHFSLYLSLSVSESLSFFTFCISNKNCRAHDILQLKCKQNIFQNVFHQIEKKEGKNKGVGQEVKCNNMVSCSAAGSVHCTLHCYLFFMAATKINRDILQLTARLYISPLSAVCLSLSSTCLAYLRNRATMGTVLDGNFASEFPRVQVTASQINSPAYISI